MSIWLTEDSEILEDQRRLVRAAQCPEALVQWRTRVQVLREAIEEYEELGLYGIAERLERA